MIRMEESELFNAKFTLSNGTELHPNYMNSEQRKKLKLQIGDRSQVMWCSCRTDTKLYYRISEDLRFYPEHNGYEHSISCIRFHSKDNKRRSAIIRSDEETATIYLQFNPKNFTIPSTKTEAEDEEEREEYGAGAEDGAEESTEISPLTSDPLDESEVLHVDKLKVDTSEYKEPKFNLASFIRCINHDTFTERTINSKPILSKDYFTSALFGRLKDIRISGMSKSIRNLSLEDDGVRFIYAPFVECEIKNSGSNKSHHIIIKGNDNNTYSLFTFESIFEKAKQRFNKQYGIEPNENTMIGGFQYYPLSKNSNNHYKVIGRMHLFQVSDHGLFCNSVYEQNAYNTIINYIKSHSTEKLRFYIPAEDESNNGILEVPGSKKKGLIIFPSPKGGKEISVDRILYEPLLLNPNLDLTEDILSRFVNILKEYVE